ncbi:hypothetical protein ACIA49_05250 [Kribbella sp. NPDC051587]|uniref:hypothetical protein n=1 Tax=Kribbella sp. NPDC051587 TaxID=3364119 RepID=UPI0037B12D51
MEYLEFDTERRRIVHAYGREITDPEELAAAVERLRELAATVDGEADRAKAFRYLTSMDDLVREARTPDSETVWAANDAMMRGLQPIGTPAEQQARARAAMDEINRIAAAAPTIGEQIAAQEMNGALAEFIHVLDTVSAED